MKKLFLLLCSAAFILALAVGYILFRRMANTMPRSARLGQWFSAPEKHPDWLIAAGSRCGDAPLVFPTNGYIGFLWDDSWKPGHRHEGIDIFGPDLAVNKTPIVAAYDGYLSRLPDWKSTVIIRVPDDPLQPGRQIWMYYTHMADGEGNSFVSADFPPGTSEVPVKAGTLLGHQGNYSGDPSSPTGIHLHFSIVKDDGQGKFTNELKIENTIDPSPYLGLALNANTAGSGVIRCLK